LRAESGGWTLVGRGRAIIRARDSTVRTCLACALFAVVLAGCGGASDLQAGGTATDQRSIATSERVERCTDRFLERVEGADSDKDEVRHYVEVTYCAPFAERGWVYEDGTLNIKAYTWLIQGSSEACASASGNQPAQTVPCEQVESAGGIQILDCAILHQVRRSEVREYVEELERTGEVECDDGTPLEDLGASG
jgi:hypothetical protein